MYKILESSTLNNIETLGSSSTLTSALLPYPGTELQ